jgi:hypothetical protein
VTWLLFVIGAMTAIGCGWNIVAAPGNWLRDLIWILGGLCGAGIMVIAILLNTGWQP